MKIEKSKILGLDTITLEPLVDERGFFMRTYDKEFFIENGIDLNWVQENHSKSEKKGIIRGLHFQFPPYSESKLVRCIKGAILDVFVDLRKNSKTFAKWESFELSEDNNKMILIPRGFAHGFCTLTDESEVIYKVDNYYSKKNEAGLVWDDPELNINWPFKDPILSEKDKKNLTLREFINNYSFIELE